MNNSTVGTYLVDGDGFTLYYFLKDTKDKSNAAAAIIAIWPVFFAENFRVPSSLSASDFGTITRSDGIQQTTYKGWPLYYYTKDTAAGQVNGQGFNNLWYVIVPSTLPTPSP
jgi:predicted lipoprotein with Yx(FWY)xxD motif